MKTTFVCATIVSVLTAVANAQNANISWNAPLTISGTSDVSTLGTYFGSWAPQDGNANTLPVNGVTFQGFSDLPSLSPDANWDNGYSGFNSPGTSDANYNALLQYARFSNETAPLAFSWAGMTPGDTYLVEFWVQDGRNSVTAERSETLTGGASTSAALFYGSGSTGPGQYILGTFVADGTGSQSITVTPFGGADIGASAQINLFQVRDITPAPEPSTLAVLALGASAMFFVVRWKSRAI